MDLSNGGGWRESVPPGTEAIVAAALAEDVGSGDLSVHGILSHVSYRIEAQAKGVACGIGIAASLLPEARPLVRDGDRVSPGSVVVRGRGDAAALLTRERTALNFLTCLSGVASLTAAFVQAVREAGTTARIVDTRKTIPGLRRLQKYAVRCGGGANHRFGLDDGAMIKDNHIASAGGIALAVAATRARIPHTIKIEVECETDAQVAEAIAAGAEIVMLDNMTPGEMARIVAAHRGAALFEASGGVTLENVAAVARSGVDLVSVGAITHSAPALAFHLEIEPDRDGR